MGGGTCFQYLFFFVLVVEKHGMYMKVRYCRIGNWRFYFNILNTLLVVFILSQIVIVNKVSIRPCSTPQDNARFQLVANLFNYRSMTTVTGPMEMDLCWSKVTNIQEIPQCHQIFPRPLCYNFGQKSCTMPVSTVLFKNYVENNNPIHNSKRPIRKVDENTGDP